MGGRRRCATCGGELREGVETLSFTLARCGVVASVDAPAQRCAACGGVHVEDGAAAHARLAIACALADRGVHTGDALRPLREALGLRACDLARLLGVTPETISHWETGKLLPARGAFVAVAAMADDAVRGRTTTRDRLEVLAAGRPFPRTVTVAASPPARRRG
jgi:HTH-type transcriptional regulator/antitoxin MqsA